ncbi:MAG: tRNA dihydrouridine(20/20a) synthase DusA [Pseudomonadota bacterium]
MSPKIAVAPMMDWTDRHCRYLMRLISPNAFLYTEMVTAAAIEHGDRQRLLGFNEIEHPVAVQLGGSDPDSMASAATISEGFGYDEININVGCPSDRVQSGQFGACLMAEPERVAACFTAMQAVVATPVTVKCRLGIDDQDSVEFLYAFVDSLAEAGCRRFIVHARIAILDGLSPKENRTVPPLNYERVYQLKQDYPDLDIALNGGLTEVDQVKAALRQVDGVMIGREAYHNPYFLAELEQIDNPDFEPPERDEVVRQMLPYIDAQLARGVRLGSITRHMLGLFSGQGGARAWRRTLSEEAHKPDAGIDVVELALDRRAAIAA